MSDPDERDVLVCVRVASMPRPGVSSIGDVCAVCAQPVWRSIRSTTLELRIVCIPCALVEMPAGQRLELAPYVAADLRQRRLS